LRAAWVPGAPAQTSWSLWRCPTYSTGSYAARAYRHTLPAPRMHPWNVLEGTKWVPSGTERVVRGTKWVWSGYQVVYSGAERCERATRPVQAHARGRTAGDDTATADYRRGRYSGNNGGCVGSTLWARTQQRGRGRPACAHTGPEGAGSTN
jgi:hypothetical protein